MKPVHAELRLLALVGTELRIDADGSIWRIAASPGGYGNDTPGRRPAQPIPARRAEHRAKDGYLRLSGNVGAGQIKCLAHRLVWVSIHGPIPDGVEINHGNGVKSDNRPDNLELLSKSGNCKHRVHVLGHPPFGGKHRQHKVVHALVPRSA